MEEYVKTCNICQLMKSDTSKSKGLLQPIPIPTAKWQQVSTDLVTKLPESHGYTAVIVFVDRLTKYCKFVPTTKEVSAVEYARHYFDEVVSAYGLPEAILSDRDPRFTSQFWRELFRLMDVKLRFSTAYHPQTDGQSEVAIRILENVMRPFVEERPQNWSEYLKALEYAVNTSVNMTTGYSPFFLLYGTHPREWMNSRSQTKVYAVQEMVSNMEEALQTAKNRYAQAQANMCKFANRKRREVEYEVGTQVLLKTDHIPLAALKKLPSKLKRRYCGPFTIEEKISPVAYRLRLPQHWKIHDVFHVSRFKDYHRSDNFPAEDPPAGELDHDTNTTKYEVDRIVGHRRQGKRRQYLVLWKGYPIEEATYEPEEHLDTAQEALNDYVRQMRLK